MAQQITEMNGARRVIGFVQPDTVIFMDDTYECYDKPLLDCPAFTDILGSLGRDGELSGHEATWLIDKDGLLLLTGVGLLGWRMGRGYTTPLSISTLFPGWGDDPYPAIWFDGMAILCGTPFGGGIRDDRLRVAVEVRAGEVADFVVYEAGCTLPRDVQMGQSIRPQRNWLDF